MEPRREEVVRKKINTKRKKPTKKKISTQKWSGIRLDVGCGEAKNAGCVGMDRRRVRGVDIVHDLEKTPWPLKKESVIQIFASHIIEHIKPWLFIDVMDEMWRVCKVDAQLLISAPYGASRGFQQDPTHCNMVNESTFRYFTPGSPVYNIYKPKPWRVESCIWNPYGNIEVILAKIAEQKGKQR